MGSERYSSEMAWRDAPIHEQPPFPGVKNGDYYQGLVDDLPDHWQDEVIDRHLNGAAQHGLVPPFETDPPNPFLGSIVQSLQIAELVQAVLINGDDINSAVDTFAEAMADTLENAK